MKKNLFLISSLVLTTFPTFGLIGCKPTKEQKFTFKDMTNSIVSIKKPKKIAIPSRAAFDMMVAFGLSDYIDGVCKNSLTNPWVSKIFPKAKDFYSYSYNPTIETFLKRNVDLVITPENSMRQNLNSKGLDAFTISQYHHPEYTKEDIFTFPNILKKVFSDNKSVITKIDNFIEQTNVIINKITSKLENVNANGKLFYWRSDKKSNQAVMENDFSFVSYSAKLLKTKFVGLDYKNEKISDEELIKQNPDTFIFGGQYQNENIEKFKTNAKFAGLKAIKENRLFNLPLGFVMFEQLGVEIPIYLAHLANILYPKVFNFDIRKMIKDCYKYYFNYSLTSNEIELMLLGKTN